MVVLPLEPLVPRLLAFSPRSDWRVASWLGTQF